MKSRPAERKLLARPVADGWELWSFEPTERLSSAATLAELEISSETVIALPAAGLLAVALRLSTQEESELREMILLQLEGRGFAAIDSMEFVVTEAASSQTLVTAWVLPVLPAEIGSVPMAACCVPSPTAESMPADACTLWREAGRWVCAVTSSGKVVSSQALGSAEVCDDLKAEVLSLVVQLVREKILSTPPPIIVRDGPPTASWDGWPVLPISEERPAPVWPSKPAFFPRLFAERRAVAKRRRMVRRGIAAVSIVLAVVVTAYGIHTAWMWANLRQMTAQLAADENRVDEIRKLAEAWNALAPAVEPDQSAVEILYRCARHLPPAGVRFTLFQIKNGNILLLGEGDNVSGVVTLQNRISNDKELADIRWKMPPPRILPNGFARFEISGDRLSYATLSK